MDIPERPDQAGSPNLHLAGGRDASDVGVLVVDDHDMFRETTTELLTAHGFTVLGGARNGLEAIELTRSTQPDVVLMDVHMPRVDGIEATQRISAECSHARVLVFTFSADEDDVLNAITAGASGYLLKTTPLDQLVAGIYAAANGETLISPSITAQLVRRVRSEGTATAASAALQERAAGLTPRERDILKLIAHGKDNSTIGKTLFLSDKTVKNHITALLRKLELANRTEAAVFAVRSGLD